MDRPRSERWPAAYGYVRAVEASEDELAKLRQEIVRFCQMEGYQLVTIFWDRGSEETELDWPGLAGLLDALALPDSACVVVPDLRYLSQDKTVREGLVRQIHRAGTTVLVTRPANREIDHGRPRLEHGEPAELSAGVPLDAEDDTKQPWCHRPIEVDMNEPSVSRVYDAYLGGAANSRADRDFAVRIQAVIPDVQELAVANRRFLARGVEFTLRHGVDQVLDIGAGVPSIWLTHHVAHALNPACRVVYVDHEAVAYEALCLATAEDERLGVVRADVREVEAVLADPVVERLLDLSRPVVLVMGLLLHFIPDSDDPAGLLRQYREATAPGSYLVLSHDTADGREDAMRQLVALYAEMGRPVVLRNRDELAGLLDGFELVEPGTVHMPLWRPTEDDPVIEPAESWCVYAAVAKT